MTIDTFDAREAPEGVDNLSACEAVNDNAPTSRFSYHRVDCDSDMLASASRPGPRVRHQEHVRLETVEHSDQQWYCLLAHSDGRSASPNIPNAPVLEFTVGDVGESDSADSWINGQHAQVR
jgi:hypothetical protein